MKFNFKILNRYRIEAGDYGTKTDEKFGAFIVPFRSHQLRILATDGKGFNPEWEHVSVSLPNRCPNWEEMCFVKSLFWDEEETVIQYHPPKRMYINCHPYCLHLWKQVGKEIELPPLIYVGFINEPKLQNP